MDLTQAMGYVIMSSLSASTVRFDRIAILAAMLSCGFSAGGNW